jgi:hypothetical protein
MVVRTKPICDVCGNRHTIHEDGFEILDCILYLKNKETEEEKMERRKRECVEVWDMEKKEWKVKTDTM